MPLLRRRLCEMAPKHVRYGYRRLTVLLRREGWKVNAKRILLAVQRGAVDRSYQVATQDGSPSARNDSNGHGPESVLEHGFHER
jgi:hypothetical protein